MPLSLFKKNPQQRLTLDQSEWLVLKELASFFLSVEFPGSQLEALLRARAPLSQSNTDVLTTSILTPFSASGLEANAEAQAIQTPLAPSLADSTASSTPRASPSPESEFTSDGNESHSGSSASTRLIVDDRSFQSCTIDGSGSSRPVVIDNFSHLRGGINGRVTTSSFSHSTIKDATINNHSWNHNVDCFNS